LLRCRERTTFWDPLRQVVIYGAGGGKLAERGGKTAKKRAVVAVARKHCLLNREHPTGTQRKSLNCECGWKAATEAAWLSGKMKTFVERAQGLVEEGIQ